MIDIENRHSIFWILDVSSNIFLSALQLLLASVFNILRRFLHSWFVYLMSLPYVNSGSNIVSIILNDLTVGIYSSPIFGEMFSVWFFLENNSVSFL